MPRQLTVAFINFTRRWGGVKTWTLDFGAALLGRGHRVVAVVRPDTPFEEACRQRGFIVHAWRPGPKYNPLAILRVWTILRAEGADVAVVNISKDLNIGAVAARLGRVPVLHRIGLLEDFKDSGEERLWHRWLVDHAIVPSEYLRDQLAAELGWFDQERISVIPNSKPVWKPEPSARKRNSRFTFGVTSQLSPSKGHRYLLDAAERLQSEGGDLRVRIAGVGVLGDELRAEVERRGLTGMIEFCGFQTDVPGFLTDLDAYVLPSLHESFSNAVLEAMACGLPVIAFEAGGVPEVVGEAGILTPPCDVTALAQAMGRLMSDPKLCLDLGRAASARVAEKFDVETNVEALEALIRRVVDSPDREEGVF